MTSSGRQKRTRSERVAALVLPPGQWRRTLEYLHRGDVLLRLGLCLLAALVLWVATAAWAPPFAYRTGYTPSRDIVARVGFQEYSAEASRVAREEARRKIVCIYTHDPRPLVELQQALKNKVFQIVAAGSYSRLDKDVWRELLPEDEQGRDEQQEREAFEAFRGALAGDAELVQFERAVQQAFAQFQRRGLLVQLEHELGEGSQTEILVHSVGRERELWRVDVDDVQIAKAALRLEQRLVEQFRALQMEDEAAEAVARHLYIWLDRRLPTQAKTLSLNTEATRQARDRAERQVQPVMIQRQPGETLVPGGERLEAHHIPLLRLEHQAMLQQWGLQNRLYRSLAALGMYVALYTLCGYYIARRERWLLDDLRRFASLLVLVVVTVGLCGITSGDQWRAEIIPLLLFGMTVAIAYQQELSLLLSAAVALVVVFSLGFGLVDFVILVATVAAAIFLLAHIRTRTKLIYVSLWAALVALFTTLGVHTLAGQPVDGTLLGHSLWLSFCTLLAGLLMTGLLPFIERLFDVQTDISLLELGDPAHPLLQELARRAPGTYNHSINVASIGQAAAEAIGANGLLVRVGAYFHDIGKMLKPGYFVENQGQEANRHESLLPAMSTLVIIAHVKDGADLARQHHLPHTMIDFIEQHHGTTLVEYFFNRAARRCADDPNAAAVDEANFRYPGPKPQSPEAGVMMLADAVESACRSLVDPAPARIESLVREIVMKRLLDGQFDECGLTLQQLNVIEQTLVKSLTAVYHGRVLYPDQQTA